MIPVTLVPQQPSTPLKVDDVLSIERHLKLDDLSHEEIAAQFNTTTDIVFVIEYYLIRLHELT
jgi:hypothetical protein